MRGQLLRDTPGNRLQALQNRFNGFFVCSDRYKPSDAARRQNEPEHRIGSKLPFGSPTIGDSIYLIQRRSVPSPLLGPALELIQPEIRKICLAVTELESLQLVFVDEAEFIEEHGPAGFRSRTKPMASILGLNRRQMRQRYRSFRCSALPPAGTPIGTGTGHNPYVLCPGCPGCPGFGARSVAGHSRQTRQWSRLCSSHCLIP
jgi:hypothetical protein